jgi:hypothetical protein
MNNQPRRPIIQRIRADNASVALGKPPYQCLALRDPRGKGRPHPTCTCGSCALSRSIRRGQRLMARKPDSKPQKLIKILTTPALLQSLIFQGAKTALACVVFSTGLTVPLLMVQRHYSQVNSMTMADSMTQGSITGDQIREVVSQTPAEPRQVANNKSELHAEASKPLKTVDVQPKQPEITKKNTETKVPEAIPTKPAAPANFRIVGAGP